MSEILLGTVLLTALLLLLALAVLAARAVISPMRPATVTVNGSTSVPALTGEKLLAALNEHGVLVPSACAGAGTCGLCRVRVTEGDMRPQPTELARLSKAELREGARLACQVVVRGDLGVEVDEALIGAEPFETVVTGTRFLTPLIREVVLQMPEDRRPALKAGDFVQVTAPPYRLDFDQLEVPERYAGAWKPLRGLSAGSEQPVTRAYSVSNRPEDTAAGRLVLNIRLALPPPGVADAPPGVVSSWLFSVGEGERILTSGPFGGFHARPTEREMIFIGGGVGMAPLRAIIHEQLMRGSTRTMSYWYGARSRAEIFYAEEFEALAEAHPNFRWHIVLSDPAPGDDWQGPTGFVHTSVWQRYLRDHPAPEECEYYLCGPPLMIRAVFAMLEDTGVERDSIFFDDFGV